MPMRLNSLGRLVEAPQIPPLRQSPTPSPKCFCLFDKLFKSTLFSSQFNQLSLSRYHGIDASDLLSQIGYF